jgi:hypothetical protein
MRHPKYPIACVSNNSDNLYKTGDQASDWSLQLRREFNSESLHFSYLFNAEVFENPLEWRHCIEFLAGELKVSHI